MMNGLMFVNAAMPGATVALPFFFGSTPRNSLWTTNNASTTAIVIPGGITFGGTFAISVFGGISAMPAGNSAPGIAFTPLTTSATYFIHAQILAFSGGTAMYLSLNDAGAVLINEPRAVLNNFSIQESQTANLCVVYSPGTTSMVTINVATNNLGTGQSLLFGDNKARNQIPTLQWTLVQVAP